MILSLQTWVSPIIIYTHLRRCLAWFDFTQKLNPKVTTNDGLNIHICIYI